MSRWITCWDGRKMGVTLGLSVEDTGVIRAELTRSMIMTPSMVFSLSLPIREDGAETRSLV